MVKIIYRSQNCMVMVKIKYQTPSINGIKLYLNVYRLYLNDIKLYLNVYRFYSNGIKLYLIVYKLY